MAETAVVVEVLEVEALVGHWRSRYTSDGAEGMRAHVTLLYPFADRAELSPAGLDRLTEAVGSCEAFAYALRSTATFAGPEPVLYLAPVPPTPFRGLIQALAGAFPEYPPYRGAHEEIVPHVTVATSDDSELLARIEADVRSGLPLAAAAREVWLMEHRADGWRKSLRLPLRAS
ncbi:MAG: 2'-5' RNA ligase family protein [Gaiellaceae bacterium]